MTIVRSPKLSQDAETILSYMSGTKDALERHKRKIKSTCHLTDDTRADKAFAELFSNGLVSDVGEGLLDLTEDGLQVGQSLKKPKGLPRTVTNNITNHITGVEGGTVNMTGLSENGVLSTPLNYESLLRPASPGTQVSAPLRRTVDDDAEILRTLRTVNPEVPGIDVHPMRAAIPTAPAGRGAKPAQPKNVSFRFLLAFDQPKNALPIPILHGDIIGRSKKNSSVTLVLSHDEYVSNRHCKFEIAREKNSNRQALFVEDLGSRNGTFVDDLELYEGKLQLTHGSRLRIGNTTFVVVEVPY